MFGHDIIVIGASAGGVEALSQLVAGLPRDLAAAIFVVIHISPHGKSVLPSILNRQGKLPASHAIDGEAIAQGHIYIAPPDYHLLVKPGYIRLVKGPRENNSRPAVDPLFRTAAKAYGRRVVGVILSGTLDDGTAGLIDVKNWGGVAVVQDPNDAAYSGMPSSAIENVEVDYILPASSIPAVLESLACEPAIAQGAKPMSNESEMEPDVVELDGVAMRERGKPGVPSNFTLYELNKRNLLQYRCRTGHAFSSVTLLALQSEVQEEALWAAIRSLEERGELMNNMASKAHSGNRPRSAKRFQHLAREAQQRADVIREALFQSQLPHTVLPEANEDEGENGRLREPHPPNHPPFKVVVLVGTNGGLRTLSQILPALPENFPAAMIVMQHLDAQSDSSLIADAVNRPTTLPIKYAQAGDLLQPGMVHIAPPTQHLLVNPNGTLSLSPAVFVDFTRPSIDLLLQSVAATFTERAIAVMLSEMDSDAALGVQAIQKMGGQVIALEDSAAEYVEGSNAVTPSGRVDLVVPLNAIASTLVNLVTIDSTR
jgi:two-component system, chemotaxis family, protein-glutamate methylesterase/glutaminase